MAQAVCHSLWNTSDHLVDGVGSINMKACYPASPQDYTASAPASASASASNDSAEPSHADPLVSHALSYLNGGGGSGKTTRANEVFRGRKPLVFTPYPPPGQGDEIQGRRRTDVPQLLQVVGPERLDSRPHTPEAHPPGCYLGRGLQSPGLCSRSSSIGLFREVFRLFAVVTRGSLDPLRGHHRTPG